MKTEELTALGLTEDQIKQIFVINGQDVNAAKEATKKQLEADFKIKEDDLQKRLNDAETTLKSFEGVDLEKIQQDIQTYKEQAENAEKDYQAKITARDQKDWIKTKLDEYGVASPYARTALENECMSQDSGLSWKDGAFFGFDDFMKAAKAKDNALYQTAEEKEALEKAKKLEEGAPAFTSPLGKTGESDKKYVPPKIF